MSGGRFKFPDEISRDDLGVSGDDHFHEIYASPAQQQYIDGTIRAITGGGDGSGSKPQEGIIAMAQGATMYSDRFDDEDLNDPENQEDLFSHAPQQFRSKAQQYPNKQANYPIKINNERMNKQVPARKAKMASAGFGGGASVFKSFGDQCSDMAGNLSACEVIAYHA